jgi:hypothetical protein
MNCPGLHCDGCGDGGSGLLRLVIAGGALVLAAGAVAAIEKAFLILAAVVVFAALSAAVLAAVWFARQLRPSTTGTGNGLMSIESREARILDAPRARPQLEAGDTHYHVHYHAGPADTAPAIRRTWTENAP